MLVLLGIAAAVAADCSDVELMKSHAFRGKLAPDEQACIEAALPTLDPAVRVDLSFALILQAYMTHDVAYPDLMRRHLTEVHTTDPEVAYLYANWLKQNQPDNAGEILRWSRIAMAGRMRWADDPPGYVAIVRSLYDMLVESSLERAVQLEAVSDATPNPDNSLATDKAKREARYWLVVAAPCLHNGDCGPRFEVEVEGQTSCEDLDGYAVLARQGTLTEEPTRCLEARYERNPKDKVVGILMDAADHDPEGGAWEQLLAWHWDQTGADDPLLAARYASYLAAKGPQAAADVWKWTQIALGDRPALTTAGGRPLVGHVLTIRATAAKQLAEAARGTDGADEAKERARAAAEDRDAWCQSARDCPD
jgi:hypothetical protein